VMARSLYLREGGTAALVSLASASLAVAVAIGAAGSLRPVVLRIELGAVFLLVLGIGVGSERVIALATAPALIGAVLALSESDRLTSSRAIIIACTWYVAVESGLASVERRTGAERTQAVGRQRTREVATVAAAAAIVGAVGAAFSSLAPERTVMVRAAVVTLVVLGLVLAIRALTESGSVSE